MDDKCKDGISKDDKEYSNNKECSNDKESKIDIIPLMIKYSSARDKNTNNSVGISKIVNSDSRLTISELVIGELVLNTKENGDRDGDEEADEDGARDGDATKAEPMFYILNGRLVQPETILAEVADPDRINVLECHARIPGGFDLEDIPIIGQVFQLFGPLINPVVGIGNFFIFLLQLIIWLGKFIYWFIFFVAWAFSDLLNPIKLIADFWNSIIMILLTIINTIFGVAMGLAAFVTNQIGQWMLGFWGWDQSDLTKLDKQSNYFRKMDLNKRKKCYLTNNNKVPFSVLLGTILCPPMGVFMDLGLTGWMNIMICGLLTLLFYLPGLFYALLVIYA